MRVRTTAPKIQSGSILICELNNCINRDKCESAHGLALKCLDHVEFASFCSRRISISAISSLPHAIACHRSSQQFHHLLNLSGRTKLDLKEFLRLDWVLPPFSFLSLSIRQLSYWTSASMPLCIGNKVSLFGSLTLFWSLAAGRFLLFTLASFACYIWGHKWDWRISEWFSFVLLPLHPDNWLPVEAEPSRFTKAFRLYPKHSPSLSFRSIHTNRLLILPLTFLSSLSFR